MSSLNPPLYSHPRRWTYVAPKQLRLRLRVMLRSGHLDAMLAQGAEPTDSAELCLRARRLTSARYRRALAGRLEEIVSVAERPGPRLSAAPPLQKRDVRAARAALLELAHSLRSENGVMSAGVALAQRLMTDGASPLYASSHDDALWQAVRHARAVLVDQD